MSVLRTVHCALTPSHSHCSVLFSSTSLLQVYSTHFSATRDARDGWSSDYLGHTDAEWMGGNVSGAAFVSVVLHCFKSSGVTSLKISESLAAKETATLQRRGPHYDGPTADCTLHSQSTHHISSIHPSLCLSCHITAMHPMLYLEHTEQGSGSGSGR